MKKPPILTIGIPTYNSADYLRQTLNNIIAQVQTSEVEIVVSDNGSTDHTQAVYQDCATRFSGLRYFRNDTNHGPDSNFDLVMSRSTGRYVWLFGDDDQLTDNSLDIVLNVLKQDKIYNHIFVSYSEYDQHLEKCTNSNVLAHASNDEFNDYKNHLRRVGIAPLFMSANIFRREAWLNVDRQAYIGSGWVHYAVFLKSTVGSKNYCIGQPLVKLRRRASWTGGGKIWHHHLALSRILKTMRSMGHEEAEARYLWQQQVADIQITFVNAKRSGLTLTPTLCVESLQLYWTNWKFWLVILPLALLPNRWVTALWVLSKKLRALRQPTATPSGLK